MSEDREARRAWSKVQKADLNVLAEYLLFQWATSDMRKMHSEIAQYHHELRRAARRAIRLAKERTDQKRAVMFRKRELDALLSFAGTTTLNNQGGSFEEAVKGALKHRAPVRRGLTLSFYLALLRRASELKGVGLTWNEIVTLSVHSAESAGYKARPDDRDLRRYYARHDVRGLDRWIHTFAPVVDALWKE